jgi:hypothetical protein
MAFWFANLTVNAQQPETVDVVFFTTYHTRSQSDTTFTMTIKIQTVLPLTADEAATRFQSSTVFPCSIPNTFNSNGFSIGFSGFNWGFDKYVRFTSLRLNLTRLFCL